jgi:butyrate kinase
MFRILVVNVGSTSVKLGLFHDREQQAFENSPIGEGSDDERTRQVTEAAASFMGENGVSLGDLAAISARGGVLKPLAGGTYLVDDAMLTDLAERRYGVHPSNLSARAARQLAEGTRAEVFVVDPVTVDELEERARPTGIPSVSRRSIFHALSQRAAARRAAESLGKTYEEANLVVAHMGGGISVGAHRAGRVIDVNNALDGDGPIAPERAGTVPAAQLARLCFSREHTMEDVAGMLTGEGGMKAHLGTSDMTEVEKLVGNGDEKAVRMAEAMAYTIAKEIGAMAAALGGEVDAVVLTGGMAGWDWLTKSIEKLVSFVGPLVTYPENLEMEALALGALRVLNGEEEPLTYA